MKIEKNKIVFGSVLAIVIIFIVAYTMLLFTGENKEPPNLKQTRIPALGNEQEEYNSKLDAVNALKEVKETNAPSIYDEKFLDSLGYFDPDLRNKQKEKMVDSIYKSGKINYTENSYRNSAVKDSSRRPEPVKISIGEDLENPISAKELGLEHQLFYSSSPTETGEISTHPNSDAVILVEVVGNQVVQAGYRLRMRLTEAAVINNSTIPENTPVFGFISFQPNRALIEIENINHQPVKLKAYDLQDGSEGIYVENSIRSEAGKEVVDDIIQDIDIPGVPQVGGIKKVFQRNNKKIKVTVTNNYKLILKGK